MTLSELFSQCIRIKYEKVGVSANYAIKREGNTLYVFFEDSDGKIDWKNNLDFPAKAYNRVRTSRTRPKRVFSALLGSSSLQYAGMAASSSPKIIEKYIALGAKQFSIQNRVRLVRTRLSAWKKRIWFAHRGFLRVWKEIEPSLAPEIADKGLGKIVIAGYSHGGALAMLCHEYVWYHRADLRATLEGYGFGAPRVFWGIKTKALKERWAGFTVIRNLDDLVTHLPPWIFGYSHVGKMVKIGQRGRYSPIEAHYAENILKELFRFSP